MTWLSVYLCECRSSARPQSCYLAAPLVPLSLAPKRHTSFLLLPLVSGKKLQEWQNEKRVLSGIIFKRTTKQRQTVSSAKNTVERGEKSCTPWPQHQILYFPKSFAKILREDTERGKENGTSGDRESTSVMYNSVTCRYNK